MMLHSLRKSYYGAAFALIAWSLMNPIAAIRAETTQAETTREIETALRVEFPPSGDDPQLDWSSAQTSLISIASQSAEALEPADEPVAAGVIESSGEVVRDDADRFWLFNTRHLTSSARCVNLDEPAFAIYRLDACSRRPSRVTVEEYLQAVAGRRYAVIYVHGNRIPSCDAVDRGFAVYRNVKRARGEHPVDWIIWSWPSNKQGILMHDARIKASRTDGQGLYLGWLLRRHAATDVKTSLIGYSFGGRIITGALHAAAGGALGGRQLPGEPVVGGPFDAGLVAPAVDSHWLTSHGYHRLATQNLEQLVLMYNRRDAVLKRYWLIDRVRGRMALGYSGPTSFAPRFDGSKLPIRSRDCSPSIGLQHDELDYYRKSCNAGSEMAKLINDFFANH